MDESLIGSAVNRFFSEVDRQFRGVCRIRQYERTALGARFHMDEVKHNYDVGGTNKVSDRAGQGRVGVREAKLGSGARAGAVWVCSSATAGASVK